MRSADRLLDVRVSLRRPPTVNELGGFVLAMAGAWVPCVTVDGSGCDAPVSRAALFASLLPVFGGIGNSGFMRIACNRSARERRHHRRLPSFRAHRAMS